MKNMLVMLLITLVLNACSQQEATPDKTDLERQEGIVALKRKGDDGQPNDQILLIPNITTEDIVSKTPREIVRLAQKNNGAYYGVSTDDYNELDIGTNITVYWGNGQEDSDPPQRVASIIEVNESS